MLSDKRLLWLIVAFGLFAAAAPGAQDSSATGNAAAIARGKYIVENVAVCPRCHTPRDENGALIRSRWLTGAAVWISPLRPVEAWANEAPRLAGLPPGTDQQIITLLTTGIARTGRPPRPPMLQFHMTRADAEAVLAYLKSLHPAG